ncbi:hypothetical protein B0T18DRAFT_394581 [Schizothecium vesticola]|uniref:Uncharacterized protein n=1 Tax=Schizothecium vesticola TaxID=314040 RepID=A0AA40EH07_9PEZI|nr:hypothetical protein B0T18DRAFT_394581 [Schizothecium vesticola]
MLEVGSKRDFEFCFVLRARLSPTNIVKPWRVTGQSVFDKYRGPGLLLPLVLCRKRRRSGLAQRRPSSHRGSDDGGRHSQGFLHFKILQWKGAGTTNHVVREGKPRTAQALSYSPSIEARRQRSSSETRPSTTESSRIIMCRIDMNISARDKSGIERSACQGINE